MSAPTPPTLPVSWSWADVVDHHVEVRGSLAELARHLIDVAPPSADVSDDPQTVERGLRRLRARGHREGGMYGRLLLRTLGLPEPMLAWLRDLGTYHSRASDLPVHARKAQLARWDKPPTSESAGAIWVHMGLASVAHREGDAAQAAHRARLVATLARHASPAARVEAALLAAHLVSAADPARALAHLDDALRWSTEIPDAPHPDERACYLARHHDQRAYVQARGWRDDPARLHDALSWYERIPDDVGAPPFARFRRAHGLAWCLWRLGRLDDALDAARQAASHAGDGGFIRFRMMSLNQQAHMLASADAEAAHALLQRARQLAARLGDTHLTARLATLPPPPHAKEHEP